MPDTYTLRQAAKQDDPAIGAVVIDYSVADQEFSVPVRAIYIGTAGNLRVTMANGTTVTFSNLAAGVVYPFAITKVLQASSTAAGIALL